MFVKSFRGTFALAFHQDPYISSYKNRCQKLVHVTK